MNNIVLLEPLIPQNTGNIMRTCVATNTKLHLIKPFAFSLDDLKLKRSGVNYLDKLDLHLYENLKEFFEKNNGEFFFLTRYGHVSHSSFNYSNTDKNYYFFLGKETTGLPKTLLKENLNKCIRIPSTDKVRSLNVSNVAAIILYEALRQQNYPNLFSDEPHKSKFEIENS